MKLEKNREVLLSTIVKEVESNQIEINQMLQYSHDEDEIKLRIVVVSDSYMDYICTKEYTFQVSQELVEVEIQSDKINEYDLEGLKKETITQQLYNQVNDELEANQEEEEVKE